MENKLASTYKSIEKNVSIVYVSPRIEEFSKFNPYIELFYRDFHGNSQNNPSISIKSINPALPWFLFKKLLGEQSIVHCHWLEISSIKTFIITFWKLILFLLYIFLKGKIVWSVHNKFPHSKKLLSINKVIYLTMAKLATKLHAHSNESADIMTSKLKINRNKFFIVEHPLYPVSFISKNEAIKHVINTFNFNINISKPIFLIYGYIAEYKGILEILPFFIDNKIQLIIAGKSKSGEEKYFQKISNLINNKKNIFIKNQFISKEDETNLFNASDYIVFNLKDILSSGSVVLAMSYKKDIIIPNIGCLKDLSGDGIHKFTSPIEFRQIITLMVNNYTKSGNK